MKAFLKRTLSIMIVILVTGTITLYAEKDEPYDYQPETRVSYQQLKAQVSFFQDAIDELGATSPSQVADLWAKAEKMRNGVYQYSVACKELKSRIIEKWGNAEESFWIIGGSSPWLSKYEITKNEKIDNNTYEIVIKYYWTTSMGDMEPTFNTLKIIKSDSYWCVKDVEES